MQQTEEESWFGRAQGAATSLWDAATAEVEEAREAGGRAIDYAEDVGERAVATGVEAYHEVEDSGERLVDGGLQLAQQAQDRAEQLVHQAEALAEEGLERGRGVVEQIEHQARAIAARAARRARRRQRRAEARAQEAVERARAVRDDAVSDVEAVVEDVQDDVVELAQDVSDPTSQLIEGLDQEGDRRTMALGAILSAVMRSGEEIEITVTRGPGEPPSYTLAVKSTLAAGAAFELGEGDMGDAEIEGMAHIGVAEESTFANEAQLRRGVSVMLRQMLNSAPNALTAHSGDDVNNGISPADLEMMQQARRVTEIRGDIALQLSGHLGVGSEGSARVNAVAGAGEVVGAVSGRIETPEGIGGPTYVVLVREIKGKMSGNLGPSLSGHESGAELPVLDGTTETIVRYEDRYLLSDGTTMQDVLRDPASSTDDAVHTTRLVIRQESGAGLVGNGAISERELVVNSGEELMSEEAWERVAHGDMSGASEAIEHSGGEIEASESHYLTDGYNINAKPTADGFGAQFHVQNQRRRRVGDAPHPPREAGE